MSIDRSTAPGFNSINDIHFIQPQEVELKNGQKIYTLSSDEPEVIKLEFIFKHISWDKKNPLIATAVCNLLCEGSMRHSAQEIAEKIDYYGAYFQTQHTQDHTSISLFTLNKYLDKVLPTFFEIITEASFPEKEIELFIQNQQQALSVNLERNSFVARQKFNHALFGNSIYGFETGLETFELLNRESLLQFYKATYSPQNCTLIVSGKVDSSVINTLNNSIAWEYNNKETIQYEPEFETTLEKNIFVQKPNAVQSAIRLGTKSINRTHPDYAGFQVLNTILGGYFGSRLMKNIREDKGYTYGIGSNIVSLAHGGYFFIASEVGVDVCNNAINEIKNEINTLKNKEVSLEELSLVKNYMLGNILGSLENIFSHADKFKNIHLLGLNYEYYKKHVSCIENIDSKTIIELANKYLDIENFHEVVVGKR